MSRREDKKVARSFVSREVYDQAPGWMTGRASREKISITFLCVPCNNRIGSVARFTNEYDEGRGWFFEDAPLPTKQLDDGTFKILLACAKCRRRKEEHSTTTAARFDGLWAPGAKASVEVGLWGE